jgi:hypothetical protein
MANEALQRSFPAISYQHTVTFPSASDPYDFVVKNIRTTHIQRQTGYTKLILMEIGSDFLQYLVLTIDRTDGRNLLYLYKP